MRYLGLISLLLCLWASQTAAHNLTEISQPVSIISVPQGDATAMAAALKDLCDKKVVLLGEAATHGDGHTLAFKAALVQRLIETCGFKAVVFEASFYEFSHLNENLKAGATLSPQEVSVAIGGIWNRSSDMQPLISYLTDKANHKALTLAGMSGSLGAYGQTYSNDELPQKLTAQLTPGDATLCREAFRRRIYWDYPEKYAQADKQELLACLAKIRETTPVRNTLNIAILESIQRDIERDLLPPSVGRQAYDRSMFLNLRYITDSLPAGTRVIVWSATIHAAKRALAKDGAELSPIGAFLREAFGKDAFVLGFGCLGGTYGVIGKTDPVTVPAAPEDSIEGLSLKQANISAIYVTPKQLEAFGERPAALFYHDYTTLNWSRSLDGVIVFQQEYPVSRLPKDVKP